MFSVVANGAPERPHDDQEGAEREAGRVRTGRPAMTDATAQHDATAQNDKMAGDLRSSPRGTDC